MARRIASSSGSRPAAGLSVLIAIPLVEIAEAASNEHRGGCGVSKIRTMVVDDEPVARERIVGLLQQEKDIELVGECADGQQAINAIQQQHPDLVFLDVQMPACDGFGVIEQVGAERMPPVVFVTAYDEYALKAFEVHAIDYLLKPFGRDRFQQTLQHAREHLERRRAGDLGKRLLALVQDLKPEPQKLDRLVVKSGGRVFFLRTDEIDWIEAAGNYVRLHLGEDSHLFRETMNNMEARLDGAPLRPHPPLAHRQHRPHQGAAALVQRRIRRGAAERHPPDAEPRLSRETAGTAGKGVLVPVAASGASTLAAVRA